MSTATLCSEKQLITFLRITSNKNLAKIRKLTNKEIKIGTRKYFISRLKYVAIETSSRDS